MNSDVIKGKWKQLNGRIKERWGNLTDDDLDVVEGHSEYLAGKLRRKKRLRMSFATSLVSCEHK